MIKPLDKMAENARELGLDYEPRAWFTVDELNAWADKKLKENPQWAEQPAQQEPFGYFKAEPFGWTDCAESDEGAVALYERPQPAQRKEDK